jgi:putative transposase
MSRPLRIQGFPYLGAYRYFVTFCTFERRKTLSDSTIATFVLTQFQRTARAMAFEILAYCLMPDHVHLLVEGISAAADFRRFVKRLKQSSGQVYSHRAKHRLCQEGYHDRVLRYDDNAKNIARYIIANPVRAGLARIPSEYLYVGSDVWSLEELIESIV